MICSIISVDHSLNYAKNINKTTKLVRCAFKFMHKFKTEAMNELFPLGIDGSNWNLINNISEQ